MERLYLHVGLMKTGTTYLQNVWRANADSLDEQGIWYPSGSDVPGTRFAVWDLVGRRPRGAPDARVSGQWEALTLAVAARADRKVLLSEEYLAARTLRQANRAVLGFPEHEVHVIVTVRDLRRVLVSSWQEVVKCGSTLTWTKYIAAVSDRASHTRDPARGFWLHQELPQVLQVWAAAAGHDRVHVVTVPPAHATPGLLLERLGSLIGFDAARLTTPASQTNEALGASATEVIRRLNERLGGRLNQRQYDWVVKNTLQAGLSPVAAADRPVLPAKHLEWARREAERMMIFVRDAGFDVVGDLNELIPLADDRGRAPTEATDAELLESSMQALSLLAERTAKVWWASRRTERPRVPTSSRVVRALSVLRGTGFVARRKGAELADRNKVAAAAMGLYLRARGRRRRLTN